VYFGISIADYVVFVKSNLGNKKTSFRASFQKFYDQKFFFFSLQNRQFVFAPKIQYKLAAERSGFP